jgi:putative oxidoreductase
MTSFPPANELCNYANDIVQIQTLSCKNDKICFRTSATPNRFVPQNEENAMSANALSSVIDRNSAPYGALLLRVSLGTMWIAHALMKVILFTVPGFGGFLAQQGFPAALAGPVIAAELAIGALLIVGLYARHVALLSVPVMAAAMSVHLGNGWVFSAAGGGWEYPAFLIVASLVQWLVGDGAYALRSRPLLFVGNNAVAGR